ncbi:hypothetical protein GGF41_008083, partial [Coemansia sp. RSA 2531]
MAHRSSLLASRAAVVARRCCGFGSYTVRRVAMSTTSASTMPSSSSDSTQASSPRKHLVFTNRSGPSLQHFLAQPLPGSGSASDAVADEVPYLSVSDWGQGRTYYVEVYGCQMNVSDTEILMSVLNKAGYQRTMQLEDADVVFLMTCAIREKAEDKIWNRLTHLKTLKTKSRPGRPPMVGVLGCMAER